MNRREALNYTTALLGTTLFGAQAFFSGCSPKKEPLTSGDFNIPLLDEIGDLIFPETENSPGAKSVRIGEFMRTIVSECYSEEEEEIFLDGIQEIQSRSNERYGYDFMDVSTVDQLNLLREIDQEALAVQDLEDAPVHYFNMLRQLTIWGYFSSEGGATKALRYNQTPGRFDGCVPYSAGDAAWTG